MWSTRLAIVTFVVSILTMGAHHLPGVLGQGVVNAFLFAPADVRHGMLWQLATFEFVNAQPFGLLFSVYAMLVFGAGVEERVGSRAFLGWFFGLSVAASLITLGLSFLWNAVAGGTYQGADAAALGLLVVWVHLNRGAMISFFMLFPMRAEVMMYLSLGFLVLYSIAYHPALFVPDYAAFFTGMVATRSSFDLSPRRTYLKFRAWQIDRQLRKRSSKFTVISGGGEEPEDKDKGPTGGYLN